MSILRSDSLEDVAFKVCTAMHRQGSTIVLSGGGAATVYAPEAYQSRDLDFVLPFSVTDPRADGLFDLGFHPTASSGVYAHPDSEFTVEFLEGPLAVGGDVITAWETKRRGDLLLHMISPTDCVRDRLAAAIHWNDVSSVEQAAEVAIRNPIDMKKIEEWCAREGGSRTFGLFRHLILV